MLPDLGLKFVYFYAEGIRSVPREIFVRAVFVCEPPYFLMFPMSLFITHGVGKARMDL